jgi:hypothetical protein
VHTDYVSRLPGIFDGTGPLSGLGVASWMVGLVMLIAILLSPNGWGWWMDVHSVQGREINGLVFYTINGANYSVNDPQSFPGGRPHQRTVYYLSSQPSNGSLHNTGNEVIDWGLTAGPGVAGAILLATGFATRARRNRLAKSRHVHDSFGQGIPSETIKAIVERNKRTAFNGEDHSPSQISRPPPRWESNNRRSAYCWQLILEGAPARRTPPSSSI